MKERFYIVFCKKHQCIRCVHCNWPVFLRLVYWSRCWSYLKADSKKLGPRTPRITEMLMGKAAPSQAAVLPFSWSCLHRNGFRKRFFHQEKREKSMQSLLSNCINIWIHPSMTAEWDTACFLALHFPIPWCFLLHSAHYSTDAQVNEVTVCLPCLEFSTSI